ncbi:MAG TPA: hypothetical protein VGX78_18585 [Pirellulales bacterium]|jgi:hypothetical protein|nr:hypothetical protein [Pirellulales bacterium]
MQVNKAGVRDVGPFQPEGFELPQPYQCGESRIHHIRVLQVQPSQFRQRLQVRQTSVTNVVPIKRQDFELGQLCHDFQELIVNRRAYLRHGHESAVFPYVPALQLGVEPLVLPVDGLLVRIEVHLDDIVHVVAANDGPQSLAPWRVGGL